MDQTTDDPAERDALAEGAGQYPAEYAKGVAVRPWVKDHSDPPPEPLLEKVVASDNMHLAWKQVRRNKGAPGIDGRTIEETHAIIRDHWPEIRRQLLDGTYRPLPVRRVEIPKPGGGVRRLGVPTVVDRLIQQAIAQVLTPIFDPGFSESSFGFRDKELERRGHSFCRYADDVNIYVRSQRAGERTMRSLTQYVETDLKLKVNRDKSAVARPWKRSFLGFTVETTGYPV